MSGPDVKKQVGALARRINGYKGRIKLDLAKLDTNFTTLEGSPASLIQLEQVRRHFKHVDSSVQLARELYITVMGMVTESEWDSEWLQKSDDLEDDMKKAERVMEKAERVYAMAMKDQEPTPGPPGPVPAAGGKQQPKVDIHLQPDPLTEDSKATEYKVWLDGLKLWMNLSSLNEQKEIDKITILKRVISHHIAVRCDLDLKTTMAEAMAAIDKDFWNRYPVISLRIEYGKMKQKSSQKFTDFISEQQQFGQLANVEDMTSDAYSAMLLINGCVDPNLLKKLLELGEDEFTVAKITAVARKYESEEVLLSSLKKKGPKNETIRAVNAKEARCFRCDKPGHVRDTCQEPVQNLSCQVCSPGHVKARPHNESQFCRDRAASRGRTGSRSAHVVNPGPGGKLEEGGREEKRK